MSSSPVRIYHNARCSKSRSACSILEGLGVQAEVVEYLKTPPTREALAALLAMLGKRPLEVIRKGEDVFKEQYAGRDLSDEDWLDALVAHPVLLERPIVVAGGRAIVARPPEVLQAWLESLE
jgi:arsenate reductase